MIREESRTVRLLDLVSWWTLQWSKVPDDGRRPDGHFAGGINMITAVELITPKDTLWSSGSELLRDVHVRLVYTIWPRQMADWHPFPRIQHKRDVYNGKMMESNRRVMEIDKISLSS